MTQAEALNMPGTKAWRETPVEEVQEETQAVEEVEDNLLPLKDQLQPHNKSHNHKETSEWWGHSQNPSPANEPKPDIS